MGKLSPEEEARQKMLMRERDRERKRMKRMNPEYRRMEQERDRDRKKARRANEAFRQLEKLRDKIRKDRKKGIIVDDALSGEYVTLQQVPVEPEVIISDPLPGPRQRGGARANQTLNNGGGGVGTPNGQLVATSDASAAALTTPSASGSAMPPTAAAAAAHMSQLNAKGGLLGYPPPNFHHPLPIAGVALMPQLCHPILHQNLGAALYSANGIKQEYPLIKQEYAGNEGQGGAGVDPAAGNGGPPSGAGGNNRDVLNVHVNFHDQSGGGPHSLHQQQCNMFHNMAPQSHMSHMRSHASLPPPPPPPATHPQQQQQQQQQQHQQQQQQLQQHYAAAAKTS